MHHAGGNDDRPQDGRGNSRPRGRKADRRPSPPADRGKPPPNAPPSEEIEQLIQDRNEARRRGDFGQADQIRDGLKSRGVMLSDEKGGHGSGLMVTQWRYWHD